MRLLHLAVVCCIAIISNGGGSAPVALSPPLPSAVGPYTGPVGGGGIGPIGGGCVGPMCGPDFNPLLLGGRRGYPGIRARLNSRMFQYASQLVGELLNKEIQRFRLPDIVQSTQPLIDGCIVIYNAYVSRYRCPQRVVVFPKAPNHLVLQVQNLDIGVTGNLGGQINVIIPIALSGIVQINVHGVSLAVEVAIVPGPNGPRISVCACSASVDYVDVCIENGGLVGSIANSFFRRSISNMVKDLLPDQLCKMLPKVVDEQLNSKTSAIPQAIALTQLAMLAGGGLSSSPPKPDPQFCEQQCGVKMSALATMGGAGAAAPEIPQEAYRGNSTRFLAQRSVSSGKRRAQPRHIAVSEVHASALEPSVQRQRVSRANPNPLVPLQASPLVPKREKRATEILVPSRQSRQTIPHRGIERRYQPIKVVRTRGAASAPVKVTSPQAMNPAASYLCNQCTTASDDPAAFIRDLAQNLNLASLNDMFLSVQLMNTYATSNDFTLDLTGEFSPGGQGGTPFGPFPTMFPAPYDNHMIELIVSDYTINSLLYWMHKKGFLSFRVGPETPKIGELLKTTCSEGDDEDEFEATPVEIDEEARKRKLKRRHLRHLLHLRHKREARVVRKAHRKRRQDLGDAGGLSDLGICFGDILPAVREKYPNKKIAIQIHSIRAPSVLLSMIKGGTAMLDLCVDADIYIDQTMIKVGTITIVAQVDAAITNLKLTDTSGSLGLPQDALDNLGSLGKELITKLANDALQKGIPLNIAQSPNLPVTFYNPQVMIVEHGLYVAGDITVAPALLGTLSGSGSCYRF